MLLQICENGAIVMTAPKGKVIHPQHARCLHWGQWLLPEEM